MKKAISFSLIFFFLLFGLFFTNKVVYAALDVSCSANPNPILSQSPVTFTATATGGTGSYTYTWTGACACTTGCSKDCINSFGVPGTYTATVKVVSGSENKSDDCSVSVDYPSILSLFWNRPTTYDQGPNPPLTSAVTICMPNGTLVVEGTVGIVACINNPYQPIDLFFSMDAEDGSRIQVGTSRVEDWSAQPPAAGTASFSNRFTLPNNIKNGLNNVRVYGSTTFCWKIDGIPTASCWTEIIDQTRQVMVSNCDCPSEAMGGAEGIAGTNGQTGICLNANTLDKPQYTISCLPGSVERAGICLNANTLDKPQYTISCLPGSVERAGICVGFSCSANLLNAPPEADSLNIKPVYCGYGAGVGSISFKWTYNDADNDLETSFDFQVYDNEDGSPVWDKTVDNLSNPSGTSNEQQLSVVSGEQVGKLNFGKTYYWKVRVHNDHGSSAWTTSEDNFTTPAHAYPFPSFVLSPASAPLVNGRLMVSFIDLSTCYNTDGTQYHCWCPENDNPPYVLCTDAQRNNNTYEWQFGDGSSDIVKKGNNFHVYTPAPATPLPKIYSPTLTVTDDAGYCTAEGSVRITNPSGVPDWREISPF